MDRVLHGIHSQEVSRASRVVRKDLCALQLLTALGLIGQTQAWLRNVISRGGRTAGLGWMLRVGSLLFDNRHWYVVEGTRWEEMLSDRI